MSKEDSRHILVKTMQSALQSKGLHGVGLSEILKTAGLPKGSLYYHFPGGKEELALAAIAQAEAEMTAFLEQVFTRFDDPLDALAAWIDSALQRIAASRFKLGCPLAAAALDCSPDDTDLLLALNRAFDTLRNQLSAHISRAGFASEAAADLAALVLTSYEGGLMMARAAGSTDPIERAFRALLSHVRLQQKELTHGH
ncbi:TetR/AcrR family transcriptional regulator [Halopseudomonas maritima]|uniref:TetR/AcrR family transcriptional regulator n=1 Tax=Halopseudomonas maritima TaxID=2918528 RepID=UPI001EE9CAF4|nr:TetR/AcrR family transcriptional regulator [Halopseudomonas maritima]UJJ33047.1 TetR/AcrR family transcriptional regulator [Halopseudomonas maritima]